MSLCFLVAVPCVVNDFSNSLPIFYHEFKGTQTVSVLVE